MKVPKKKNDFFFFWGDAGTQNKDKKTHSAIDENNIRFSLQVCFCLCIFFRREKDERIFNELKV